MKSAVKKLTAIFLVAGILSLNGIMLLGIQFYGWSQMYSDYSQTMEPQDAIEMVFSGGEYCGLCSFVQNQQDQDLAEEFFFNLSKLPLISTKEEIYSFPRTYSSRGAIIAKANIDSTLPQDLDPPPPKSV